MKRPSQQSATPSASASAVDCCRAGRSRRPGSKIIHGNLRMDVLEGMSPELWVWLSNLGWRKAMYKYDRRKYDEIPCSGRRELNLAPADQWDKTLAAGTAAARGRGPLPTVRVRGEWAGTRLTWITSAIPIAMVYGGTTAQSRGSRESRAPARTPGALSVRLTGYRKRR